MTATLTRRAQSLNVKRNLADPWVGVDSVVEERLCCFCFALNFPNSGIRHVVWFLLEWRDKCRAEPLDAIIRLCGEVAIIERDEMSALLSAVSGFFGSSLSHQSIVNMYWPPSHDLSLNWTRTRES